jgi:hypothetical protein
MIKVNAVALNETSYYNIKSEDKPYIEKICGVYAYNSEEYTYCCELTPSYHLRYLYSYLVASREIDRYLYDALHDKYCFEGGDDMYLHCRSVKTNSTVKECGEYEDMDAACEHLQGNCPI